MTPTPDRWPDASDPQTDGWIRKCLCPVLFALLSTAMSSRMALLGKVGGKTHLAIVFEQVGIRNLLNMILCMAQVQSDHFEDGKFKIYRSWWGTMKLAGVAKLVSGTAATPNFT